MDRNLINKTMETGIVSSKDGDKISLRSSYVDNFLGKYDEVGIILEQEDKASAIWFDRADIPKLIAKLQMFVGDITMEKLMEKLPNLKVKIDDGPEFESSPVMASEVIGLATRKDVVNENIFSFVINEGQQKILVEVENQNLSPCELSEATELKIGMVAIITGQLTDEGLIFSNDMEQMQVLKAEEVSFMKIDEMDPKMRKIMEKPE